MNPDGSGETPTGVRCSDAGCAPRWQPRICERQVHEQSFCARPGKFFPER
jgi:hypothetical protein